MQRANGNPTFTTISGREIPASPASSAASTSGDSQATIRKGRKIGPNDPDNIKIYHLRVDDLLSFDAIGNILRAQYDSTNPPRKSDLSIAAVYGRFVRDAPRIAEAEGNRSSFEAIGNIMRGHYGSVNTPQKSDFSPTDMKL